MKYTLAILTHGQAATLTDAIESFGDMVSPQPADRVIHCDPGDGFCVATRTLWNRCVVVGNEFTFWLEHDFVFTRDVDLLEMAAVLREEPRLTQIAFMRNAVSAPEKRAGGLFESRRGAELWEKSEWGYMQTDYVLTTNPSLMLSQFMAANPWPDYEANCEGLFGIDLRERGFVGGVWGDGSPWVEHIGVRDGHGY